MIPPTHRRRPGPRWWARALRGLGFLSALAAQAAPPARPHAVHPLLAAPASTSAVAAPDPPAPDPPSPAAATPDPLAQLLVADATGHTHRLGESYGPTLVYFWATWCGPCRPAIRTLLALAPPAWRVLAVAVEDSPASVAALLGSVQSSVHFVSAAAAQAAGVDALPRAWWRAADGLEFTPVPEPDWSKPWPWWFVLGAPAR